MRSNWRQATLFELSAAIEEVTCAHNDARKQEESQQASCNALSRALNGQELTNTQRAWASNAVKYLEQGNPRVQRAGFDSRLVTSGRKFVMAARKP